MQVTPYLFFDGRCEEAIEFYKKTLAAQVGMMMRFKESPEPHPPGMCPPGSEDKIMHAALRIGETSVMASDGRAQGKPKFEGFTLSLNPKDETEAEHLFKALSDGGQVHMPLGKTFFAKSFGMLADRFGVGWMIIVEPEFPRDAVSTTSGKSR
jgi:PhnB protein